MLPRLVLTAFLLAHAAIHAGFVSPAPPATAGGPQWPFVLVRSWLVGRLGLDAAAVRLLGRALTALTLAGFALAALAALGVLPAALWAPAAISASVASLALHLACFHPWLVLGVAIDLGILWAVIVVGWTPAQLPS